MRRTLLACRGAKGYNWYNKFQKDGAEAFRKFKPPTPFDWSAPIDASTGVIIRPRVYFDLEMENNALGRIEFELAADVVPNTCHNFMNLVEGKGVKVKGYQGTSFHVISKNNVIMGGDVENYDGTGNHSSHEDRYIKDENFIIPHSEKGLISMASIGVHSGGSQFYIGLNDGDSNRHLNGRCVVFGRVVSGKEVVDQVSKLFTTRLKPVHPVTIKECGILHD